ncbi:MAG: ATPase domain-containing protein [Candidatus Methanoperedens sp.]
MERLPSGIKELDEKIGGGYPRARTMFVTGTTGSGKTILGIHFIHQGCLDNKKCVLLATEESAEDIIVQSESLGLPLTEYYEKGILKIDRIYEERTKYASEVFKYGIENFEELQSNIFGLLDRIPGDTEIVVIDNIGVFTLNMTPNDFRAQFDALISGLTKKNVTSMLIMDSVADERTESISSYSVYGVLRILIKDNPFTGVRERLMEFLKIRNTKIPLDPIRFDITSEGIVLLKK